MAITLACGRSISFAVPPAGDGPACFLLGVRKCGSSILNNIVQAMAALNGRGFVDVGGTFFAGNVLTRDWQRDPALRGIVRPGVIYGGFRDMPLGLLDDPVFATAPKLLMVRDPRDALVSEYFSNAYSHALPDEAGAVTAQMSAHRSQARAVDIGDYVLRMAAAMNRTMTLFASALALPCMRVVTYEDMILNKRALISLLANDFALPMAGVGVETILGWADTVPAVEDPRAFVRRVLPGDHREKLDAETIGRLNGVLRPAMSLFGYTP